MPRDTTILDLSADQPPASAPEAKLRIKELKLKKKEYQAAKRELVSQIAYVRASGRSMAAYGRVPIPIRGAMGKAMRAAARAADGTARAGIATTIRVLEYQRGQIDQSIADIDRALLQLERYLLKSGG